MNIAIASGKGGVGKSTVAASLALLFARDYSFQLIDADVDCPDLHLLFPGKEVLNKPVHLSKIAEIDFSKCTHCMKCFDECPFNAIDSKLRIDPVYCEGCGLCVHVCPEKAISLREQLTGTLKKREINYGFDGHEVVFQLIYGELEPGQSSSGRLVDELKELRENMEVTLIDSAAGVGCPVISSIQGSDLVLLVTEPTPAAFDDLVRMSNLAAHFRIPQVLVINKSTISNEWNQRIRDFASEREIKVIGEIPFHDSAFKALLSGKPLIVTDSPLKKNLISVYENLKHLIR